MENLPLPILVEILSRLGDSTDLARCRLASRTLRFLSCDVRSISVVCSRERLLRSRAPETRDFIIPFRSLVLNLLSFLAGSEGGCALRSLSISAEVNDTGRPLEEEDDLHLTAADFLSQCLPSVALGLTSLSIGDYWCQAGWRPSTALRVISEQCHNLLNLEMKNAYLSVDGLKPMPKLTKLRLELIRLDDEDLGKVIESFPSLQILKLIWVGGLRMSKINLSHLRICHWKFANFPWFDIHAPNLVELKLECDEPKYLVLEAPLLSKINLKLIKPGGLIKVHSFPYLNSIKLKTSNLKGIIGLFEGCKSVTKLELEEFHPSATIESFGNFTVLDIVSTFPNVHELKLGPGVWFQLENYFGPSISSHWRQLTSLIIMLPPVDLDIEFLSSVLNFCMPSCEVAVLLHGDSSDFIKNRTIDRCKSHFPMYKWKWGIWKETRVYNFVDFRYETFDLEGF